MRLNRIIAHCILLASLAGLAGCSSMYYAVEKEQAEEIDPGCSYFYFLWGRQAEFDLRFDEALEAYRKALICDPDSGHILRKIPGILLRLGRGEEAVVILEEYLTKNPSDSSFRMLLARVFISLGEYAKAEEQYRIAHWRNPSEITALLLLSELYLNQEKSGPAEQVLQELLRIAPESYGARVLLARIYFNAKRYDEAEAEYDAALALNWSVDILLEKGDIYHQRQDYEKVVALYREILEKDRGNEQAALALVNLLLRLEREDEALEELNRLKEEAGLNAKAELSVARLFARLEKYDQAAEILRKSLEKGESPAVQYLLAIVLTQAEKYDQALEHLSAIAAGDEEYEHAVILRVRIYRFLDRQEEAVELLEKAVSEESNRSPDMYVLLAALYHLQGKTEKGRTTFDRALSAFPEDDELLYEYGLFLNDTGEQEQALSVMQEVIKRQPANAEALNYVGYTWADDNINLDQALEMIERAVNLKPGNGYILDSLGWVYYRLSRIEEAREALEKAVELSADEPDPAVFDHLGDVYLELGRKNDAMEAYRKGLALFEADETESELKSALLEKLRLLENQN